MATPTRLLEVGPATLVVAVVAGASFTACRALLVGTAGSATVTCSDGATATLIPLQAGYNPISITNVSATGLTAANIWALY